MQNKHNIAIKRYPQTAQKCLGGNFEGGAAAVMYEGP